MARLSIYGAEVGSLAAEGTVTGSGVSLETSTIRSGSYSLKVAAASAAASYYLLSSFDTTNKYIRFYLRVTSRPASLARAIYGIPGAGTAINLKLNSDGTIAYYSGLTLIGTSTTALTDTTKWYRVEVRNADGSNVTILQIDGNSEVTGSPSSWGITHEIGANDTVADAYTAYYDDIAGDDSSFPGDGNVVMLLPTSLNAAGSWVEGDGSGTANMSAAVATRPPPGVASANETNATNIESPANSASDNCDMNMTTYTAAGVGASDTVNAAKSVIRHGEDINTGTKSGAVLIVSNPTQSGEDTFTFGNDAGAHGAETGNWITKFGTTQNAPSVTLGTAPVMRAGKRTATTRVVCVDFMGIYVDYTPAAGGFNETGSTTTPSVLAGADQNIFTDKGSTTTPTVLTGSDQDTFTDSGNVTSPATLTGDGLWIFNKAGNVTTPAALTGSDTDVFNKAGSTTTPVVLSGTEHPSDYNKTGNASTPAVLTGSDADVFNKTSGVFSPSTLSGSDANVFTDTGSTTTPVVLTGASSANQVYDKTGSIVAACALTGIDADVFNDFGSTITSSAMAGVDSSVFNDNATATAPVILAGADQNDFTKTASILSPATLTGSDADIFNKVGSTIAPVVLTGSDADVFTKTSGVFSPSTLTGSDANIFDDAGSVTTPVVLTGASAAAKVYDKTGNVTAACVLSGTDSNIFNDTASVAVPVIISGADQFISTDTASVVSPVMLSGAVPGIEVVQLPGGGRGWVVEIDAQGRQIIRKSEPQDDELEIFMSLN